MTRIRSLLLIIFVVLPLWATGLCMAATATMQIVDLLKEIFGNGLL